MRNPSRMLPILALAAAAASLATPALAGRWELGGHFVYAEPHGDFAGVARRGLGLQVHGVAGLDPAGILGLRVDLGILNYGYQTTTVPLSTRVARVGVDVNTTNNIAMLGIGPHVAVRSGPLQPYLYGTFGLGYFFTESSVSVDGSEESLARTFDLGESTPAVAFGGGLRVAIVESLDFDVGVEMRRHRRVRYLGEGDVVEEPDGGVTLRVHQSEADLVMFRVGIAFSPRPAREILAAEPSGD